MRHPLNCGAKLFLGLGLDQIGNSILEFAYRNTSRRLQRFQILTYHRVSPQSHLFFQPINPKIFEEQMKFLKRFYNVCDLQELLDRCNRGDLPSRAVAITFDDGYRDNYEFAFPILKKYGLRATIFLSTGVIGTGCVLWHDRIFDAFRFATVLRAKAKSCESLLIDLESETSASKSLMQVLQHARSLHTDNCLRFIEEIEELLRPDFMGRTRVPMLRWDQVREMHAYGIRFGSHTITHPILTRTGEEQVWRELVESRDQLRKEIGENIIGFAYPNGQPADYSTRTIAMLAQAGYKWAVTTCRGYNTCVDNPFQLKRGQPWHDEIDLFRLGFFLQRHGIRC